MKKVIIFILFLFFFSVLSHAQNVERPALYGIAKMTYRISNFDLAQSYYGEFLGFSKAFSYSGKEGTIDSYKINNRQFLEFVEDKNAPLKKRLVSVSFETENAQKMQEYLLSKCHVCNWAFRSLRNVIQPRFLCHRTSDKICCISFRLPTIL